MSIISLQKDFKVFDGFTLADTAKLLAIQNLVNGLCFYRQFQLIPDTTDCPEEVEDYDGFSFSLDDLSELNELVLSPRIKISVNHDMPDTLYVHVAGPSQVRRTAFDRLDEIDGDLVLTTNNHLETPYFRIIYIDEGAEHSTEFTKTNPSARGSRPLPPATPPPSP